MKIPASSKALFCLVFLAAAASASPIIQIEAGAVYRDTADCSATFGAGSICITSAYLNPSAWGGSNVVGPTPSPQSSDPRLQAPTNPAMPPPNTNIFRAGFDAWNATNAANAQWTLMDGTGGRAEGELSGTYDVTTFRAQIFGPNSGGLTINVNLSGIANLRAPGPNETLVWAQALFDNYTVPDGALVNPFFEMDIDTSCAANTTFCPPAYPFQFANDHFYDQPRAPFPNRFFEAEAFLSYVDYNARTLTIYDGIDYGFRNDVVPEPGTWALCVGVLMLFVWRRNTLLRPARVVASKKRN
jgi:hypothetical protein